MKGVILTVLCCLTAGRYAVAIPCPPEEPANSASKNRSWLGGNLRNDMNATNSRVAACTFERPDFARTYALTNANAAPNLKVEDDDVRLLADYYYRTRAMADEDMRQPSAPMQGQGQPQVVLQVGPTAAELRVANERDAISKLGGKLAGKTKAVAGLSDLIYASLPGYCLRENKMPPPSYFNFDQNSGSLQYVGPDPLTANRLVLANPYLVIINRRVSAARASAALQAEWIRRVALWHQNHPSMATRPGQSGVRPGGGGVPHAPVRPPVNPVPASSGTTPGSRH